MSKCSYGVTVLENAIKNWGPHASFQNMPRPILGRLVPKIYGNVWRTTKKIQYLDKIKNSGQQIFSELFQYLD